MKTRPIVNDDMVLDLELEFSEEFLGTLPGDPNVFTEFVASKAPQETQEEELAAHPQVRAEGLKAAAEAGTGEVKAPTDEEGEEGYDLDEEIKKGSTVFPVDEDGNPFIWDYMFKGFLKAAAKALRRVNLAKGAKEDEGAAHFARRIKKLQAHEKRIVELVFIERRKNPIILSGPIGVCERPLRGQTAQGERTCLARSLTIPAGSKVRFAITCLSPDLWPMIMDLLDFGQFIGLGQWRTSGKGAFLYAGGEDLEGGGRVPPKLREDKKPAKKNESASEAA